MRAWILISCAVLLHPGMAAAFPAATLLQSQSATISGKVKDPTGAGLPGVTVAASSPSLIEKTRTAVTGRDGAYTIVGLPSGTYVVTFTMPGFSSVTLEAIEIASAFTATIDAAMEAGTPAEMISVSAETPSLDTRDVSEKAVTSRLAMDTLPSDRSFISFAAMKPGMLVVGGVQNVGGSNPENALMLRVHGSRIGESRLFVDGMSVMSGNSTGGLNFGIS